MKTRSHQNRKKPRKIGHLETIPNAYYIFCEGVQTEPLYFKGFAKAIERNPIYKNMVHIEVRGVGAETMRVIYAAQEFVEKNQIHHAQIWCVYDRDSFPAGDFNEVSNYAQNLNKVQDRVTYHTAWSNQCIEYWFILHFDWYDIDNDRKDYRMYLHHKFAQCGFHRYRKNNSELFKILTEKGDPKQAMKRAHRRLRECSHLTDAASVPATKVCLLVEELARFLPDDIRQRYI